MRSLGYFTYDAADPDAQKALKRSYENYCTEHGHIDNGAFADDASDSARPQWERMLDSIEDADQGYLVVVPSAAHLGTSLHERVRSVLDLDSMDCEVICTDPDRPDPIQSALRPADARESRSEKIREGMRAKAVMGLGLGKPPYGYKILWDGKYEVVEKEAAVVRAMFQRYADEPGGVRVVATWLNGSGRRTRRGKAWSMVTVRDILRNTAYIGTYRRFGMRLPSTIEPIVDRELFRRVQDKMEGRSPSRRVAPKSEPYLLNNIIYCGYCGQRMMGITRRQTWRRKDGERARAEYRYYQCQSRINRNRCDYRTVNAAKLEEQVLEIAKEGAGNGHAVVGASPTSDEAWAESKRSDVKARIGSIERRFRRAVERTAHGAIPLAQLRVEMVEAEANLKAANQQLELVERGAEGIRELAEASKEQLDLLWEDLDIGEQQNVLRTLVSKVVVRGGVPQVEFAGA